MVINPAIFSSLTRDGFHSSLRLVNRPKFVKRSEYDSAISRMIKEIEKYPNVVSIFQIGHIGEPGISDIDIVVVFEDGQTCLIDPLDKLDQTERYLFVHSLFGSSRRDFYLGIRYSLYHNFKWLWGEKINLEELKASSNEVTILQKQIALEFLVNNYISRTVELTYGIVDVRNLLLNAHAIRYDLQSLDIRSGGLFSLVQSATEWRKEWFKRKVEPMVIAKWLRDVHDELGHFLTRFLKQHRMYFPKRANAQFTRNIILKRRNKFGYIHSGLVIPGFHMFGQKGSKILNRCNEFTFFVPADSSSRSEIQASRYAFIRKAKKCNQENLPWFIPLTNVFSRNLV